MKVTFLAHSGFLVEWERFYTLFDFYRGELPPLDANKPLLVFVSHSHEDHFDPRIFRIEHPEVRYYLSRDIRLTERRRRALGVSDALFERTTLLRPDELFVTEAAGEPMTIRTIKSTDTGDAFLLSCEGKLVYHAGDNNWWHWESEGAPYCREMEQLYRRSIEKLAQDVRDEAEDNGVAAVLEAAMVPMDPRLEDAFGLGAEHLMREVAVKKLFPMHLWDKFDWIDRFLREHPEREAQVVRIRRDGESFETDHT